MANDIRTLSEGAKCDIYVSICALEIIKKSEGKEKADYSVEAAEHTANIAGGESITLGYSASDKK